MIFIMSDDSLTFKYMYKWLSYMGSFFFLPSANSARKGRDGGGGGAKYGSHKELQEHDKEGNQRL